MKCYFHSDLDGRCAGAIVYRANKDRYLDLELIEIDYKDKVNIEKIEVDEPLIIVDFSFRPKIMEEVLKKTKNIVWIDHHKTAFEYKYSEELKGLRDDKFSGCELAWKYFYPDIQMPRVVKLIGDRDKWAWKYGRETAEFNMGMGVCNHQPEDGIWDSLFNDDGGFHTKGIMTEGDICLKFRDMFCFDYAKSYGFETEFEGYKCFALGIYHFGSEAFGNRMKSYDICLSYEYLGDKWVVGLYSENKDIDVGKIAQKYGGGGHFSTAGLECKKLPFKKKEKKMWHKDPECEQALIRLNDTLCMWERETGRESTLILVPEAPDEPIVMSQSGKPLPENFSMTPEAILAIAMRRRETREKEGYVRKV